MKIINTIYLIIASCVLLSCAQGKETKIDLLNSENQAISTNIQILKDFKWYHAILNPVGSTYHKQYVSSDGLTTSDFSIDEKDTLEVFIAPRFLPVTIRFSNGQSFLIDDRFLSQSDFKLLSKIHNKDFKGLIVYFKYDKGLFAIQEKRSREVYSRDGVVACEQSHIILSKKQ